jgi:hypothetical protein
MQGVVPMTCTQDPEFQERHESEGGTMELTQYKKVRTGVQSNASPASVADIRRVEQELRDILVTAGFFEEVEVDHTEDPDGMVIAMCTFSTQMNEAQVATRLEQAWQERLRFEFWEAHSTLVDEDQVEFQGATRTGSNGSFVTVHLLAQKAPIPGQRMP